MAGFQLTRHVAGSPEQVFDLFADLEQAAERVSGITSLELLIDDLERHLPGAASAGA